MIRPNRLVLETDSREVEPGLIELIEIEGSEELSAPYEYHLTWQVRAPGGLAPEVLDDLMRHPCRVRFGPDAEHVVHGIVREIWTASVAEEERFTYRAVLVPSLWRLSLVVRTRVFQDLDVLGIIRAVLTEHRLREHQARPPGAPRDLQDSREDFELRTHGTYPISEYTVQYQESDLAFISRLMEHHGIFYSFAQEPDCERMVIVDDNASFGQYSTAIRYDTHAAGSYEHGTVHALERRVRVGPGSVLLREYNWRAPDIGLQSQAPADAVTGYGFWYSYGEHYKDPSEGDRLAGVRGERIRCEREVYEGSISALDLRPGHRFELADHPLGEYIREYLVTGLELRAGTGGASGAGEGLQQRVRAIPADVAYRPAQRTPRPRIDGVVHGHVDGETAGTAAPIDEHGRYKVLLPFDLTGQAGGRASRWIRMAQPSSGRGYGVHLPLHIGAEVAIAHVGGDPDRPIIMGSIHNAATVNPITNANPTQSRIRTQAGIVLTFDDDC
jgi:type VI secretion system secreted protein VgrG